jgi:hypothetical protein
MPRLPAAAAVSLLVATAVTAADWPQWRGPNRDQGLLFCYDIAAK